MKVYQQIIPTTTADLTTAEFEKLPLLYLSVFASVTTTWKQCKQVFPVKPAKEIENWTPSDVGELDGAHLKFDGEFLDELRHLPRGSGRVFLVPTMSNQAIVDAADRPWRFYQMTTGDRHPNAPMYLPKLLAAAGRNNAGRIEIFYVVHQDKYDKFAWQPIKGSSASLHVKAAKRAAAAAGQRVTMASRTGRRSKRDQVPPLEDRIATAIEEINAASAKNAPYGTADEEKGDNGFTADWSHGV